MPTRWPQSYEDAADVGQEAFQAVVSFHLDGFRRQAEGDTFGAGGCGTDHDAQQDPRSYSAATTLLRGGAGGSDARAGSNSFLDGDGHAIPKSIPEAVTLRRSALMLPRT